MAIEVDARSVRALHADAKVEARILALTQGPPPAPVTHWTTRRMAARVGVSHATVGTLGGHPNPATSGHLKTGHHG